MYFPCVNPNFLVSSAKFISIIPLLWTYDIGSTLLSELRSSSDELVPK